MENSISADEVRQTFRLDTDTGTLYWLKPRRGVPPSVLHLPAGCARPKDGRWVIRVNGKLYLRSRLVYLYIHGHLPLIVEHGMRDPTDDTPSNLRPATHSQNAGNQKRAITNTTGARGVHKCSFTGLYRVRIKGRDGGRYHTFDAAKAAANALGSEIYGEFWNGD